MPRATDPTLRLPADEWHLFRDACFRAVITRSRAKAAAASGRSSSGESTRAARRKSNRRPASPKEKKKTSPKRPASPKEKKKTSPKRPASPKETSPKRVTTAAPIVSPAASAANRIRLAAKYAENDTPWGVANVFAALFLVLRIAEGQALDELAALLGVPAGDPYVDLGDLRASERAFAVIAHPDAQASLQASAEGRHALQHWKNEDKAEFMPMTKDPSKQVNDFVEEYIDDRPFVIPDPLLMILIAAEKIAVEHEDLVAEKHVKGTFRHGARLDLTKEAWFAHDPERKMPYRTFGRDAKHPHQMVFLASKQTDEQKTTRSRRGLLFILPDEKRPNDLTSCLEDLADDLQENDGALVWDEYAKIDFSFPSFRAKMKEPVNLKGVLSQPDRVPSLFEGAPFGSKVGGHVTKVLHFASFEADRKGAVAKAATAVVIGRGMTRLPLPFRCDRPFACILGTVYEDGRFSPEFVLKVTGSCLRSDDPDGE